ncbi:MAG: hypothetical protein Q8L48_04490 [Archangium sp.]|nr:hypothetical protein [Archangium sp.]
MKVLGKDITPSKVMAFVGERLAARGLSMPAESALGTEGVEGRVDPLSFNLHALEQNADATQGLPLETHRDGLAGRAVVIAKRIFRSAGQIFINEALGRQRVFNGHVRDSYAQLAAEVVRLRQRVVELETAVPSPLERGEGQGEGRPSPGPKPRSKPKPPPAPPSAPRPPPRNTRRGK